LGAGAISKIKVKVKDPALANYGLERGTLKLSLIRKSPE
jgi:hypothetical protein